MDMDLQVGRVMEALAKAQIAENTIVIFTSDNGGERFADTWPFTGKKSELLEGGIQDTGGSSLASKHPRRNRQRSGNDHNGLVANSS